MGRLDGKVAVVIGGATGFGLATASRFAAEGATVVIAGRRGALADEVGASMGGSGAPCDITDEASVAALVDGTVRHYGALDVMVNYAGYEQNTPIAELDSVTLREMVEVQ
ncbi:MAG: SDR family NAD(P)-dependent oxidoreductase, partial [Ilumatobacteraceae bacterium]